MEVMEVMEVLGVIEVMEVLEARAGVHARTRELALPSVQSVQYVQ
jgi:hypothetical protein